MGVAQPTETNKPEKKEKKNYTACITLYNTYKRLYVQANTTNNIMLSPDPHVTDYSTLIYYLYTPILYL